ncbi:helix-turn-helix transcriptional regulator [Pseudomonas jinjuensis]|nr:response regulator transcription factor [Pseudomonas jinjuensis]
MDLLRSERAGRPREITLLTANELLGQLFRHFLGSSDEWEVTLQPLDLSLPADTALWLLDVGSVEQPQLSMLLERLLAQAPGALVNVSAKEAERLVDRHPGINGVFYSHASREQVLSGLRTLLDGGVWLPRTVLEQLLWQFRRLRQSPESLAGLTGREQEILGLAGKGLSNAEIASHLCLSPHTVKSHIHNLLGKLGASNRVEAVFLLRSQLRLE